MASSWLLVHVDFVADEQTILLAEDRDDDIILIRRAFKEGGITTSITVVRDGEEAISYLSGIGRFSNRALYPIPFLFLLDLTLPVTDGFEVLRWLRSQPQFKHLPVIVLTASDQIRDVNEAYRLGAHSFLVKSLDFHNAVALAEAMSQYWTKVKLNPLTAPPTQVWPQKVDLHLDSPPSDTPRPSDLS